MMPSTSPMRICWVSVRRRRLGAATSLMTRRTSRPAAASRAASLTTRQVGHERVPVFEAVVEGLHRHALVESVSELVALLDEGLADAVGRDAGGAEVDAVAGARRLRR